MEFFEVGGGFPRERFTHDTMHSFVVQSLVKSLEDGSVVVLVEDLYELDD